MADERQENHGEEGGHGVVFTRAAARAFRRMPKSIEDLIRDKLRQLAEDPATLANNLKALKGGEGRFRLRIGDYRAIFTIERDRIIVHDVGPRGTIYR